MPEEVTAMAMSTLTEVCAGLPLDPLPPYRPRDPSLPHAPVRTPQLSSDDKKVAWEEGYEAPGMHAAMLCYHKSHPPDQTV